MIRTRGKQRLVEEAQRGQVPLPLPHSLVQRSITTGSPNTEGRYERKKKIVVEATNIRTDVQLTSISLIRCPGARRTVNPTTMPAIIDTTVS